MCLHVLACIWPGSEAGLAPFQALTGETLQLSLGMVWPGLSQKPSPVPVALALAAVLELRALTDAGQLAAWPEGSSIHWEDMWWPLAQSRPRLEVTGTEAEARGPTRVWIPPD